MKQSFSEGALVVTSIAPPNAVLKSLAEGSLRHGVNFIVVGDTKSPAHFVLKGCDFYGMERQRALPFSYAKLCHEKSYTRKNIGYLVAIAAGAQFIVETDDDNFPKDEFWADRDQIVAGDLVEEKGWVNAYRYFSTTSIYPRGFPLERLDPSGPKGVPKMNREELPCPIQQGLADGNPDVDAIYRMLFPLPLDFDVRMPVILSPKAWCPFNSQNTTTFRDVFPLLYLPTFCTFRMTDIWRSFVAQRLLWVEGGHVSFHSATVVQDRNEHDLLKDFADEVPGYLNNARIGRELDALELKPGAIEENLLLCYQKLIDVGLIAKEEMPLLHAWLADLRSISHSY